MTNTTTFYVCFSETHRVCGSAHKTVESAEACQHKNLSKYNLGGWKTYPVEAFGLFQARRMSAVKWGFTKEMRDRFIERDARRGLPLYNTGITRGPDVDPVVSTTMQQIPPVQINDLPNGEPYTTTPYPASMTPPTPPASSDQAAAALEALTKILAPAGPSLEEIAKTVKDHVQKETAKLREELASGVRTIELKLVTAPNVPAIKVKGLTHGMMPQLLQEVALGNSCWLAGPAGSGKTHAAEQVATILDREFFIVGQILDAHADVVGYNDAHGNFMETPLYKWAISKPGAVLVLDEIDGSDPNALLKACAIFAKGAFTWPNGKTTKIPKEHILIACANTWGQGAEDGFTGRESIDGATVNRFPTRLAWDVDPELERAISVSLYTDETDVKKASATVTACQIVRRNLVDAGFQGVAWGPRDTEAAVRRSVAGISPFDTSLIATLDDRQTKLALKGVTVK